MALLEVYDRKERTECRFLTKNRQGVLLVLDVILHISIRHLRAISSIRE